MHSTLCFLSKFKIKAVEEKMMLLGTCIKPSFLTKKLSLLSSGHFNPDAVSMFGIGWI